MSRVTTEVDRILTAGPGEEMLAELEHELAGLLREVYEKRHGPGSWPKLQFNGLEVTGRFTSEIATAPDYASYLAAAMAAAGNLADAPDTEFIADGPTVTAYVHCLAHYSATFELDEDRAYPDRGEL